MKLHIASVLIYFTYRLLQLSAFVGIVVYLAYKLELLK